MRTKGSHTREKRDRRHVNFEHDTKSRLAACRAEAQRDRTAAVAAHKELSGRDASRKDQLPVTPAERERRQPDALTETPLQRLGQLLSAQVVSERRGAHTTAGSSLAPAVVASQTRRHAPADRFVSYRSERRQQQPPFRSRACARTLPARPSRCAAEQAEQVRPSLLPPHKRDDEAVVALCGAFSINASHGPPLTYTHTRALTARCRCSRPWHQNGSPRRGRQCMRSQPLTPPLHREDYEEGSEPDRLGRLDVGPHSNFASPPLSPSFHPVRKEIRLGQASKESHPGVALEDFIAVRGIAYNMKYTRE
ncbi:hypothetical protein HPB51_026439 [Rhipicephalus microplus]|uniref:Uncharacterized protein n=1 Tax=Rhipicephalus microplus TaxID=6941 RepID=A0A9J6D315_RHIMP|nr:hypothetical protein HPB51_026439 [Rhipicephalus microplus]